MSTETVNENTASTATATADESLLDEDARTALHFMLKAAREAQAVVAGSESESETLLRIFADADEKAKKADILKAVSAARENVPSEEEAKEILKKARRKYDAGLDAWNDEDTPEGFVIPEFPQVKGAKSGGSATGRGAGVPRPRGLRAETDEFKGTEEKPLTCSTLAQKIGDGIDTATLLDAWRSVAGQDSEQWSEGQTATVEVTGKSGKTHKVNFTYKSA